MARRRSYRTERYDFPEYVPVGERIARNKQAMRRMRKNGHNTQPVLIEGRDIARTWWGKSWNGNLERYADYSNRIGRGRSYVRHGAVLDLSIEPKLVTALVQGSRGTPYEVEIKIQPLQDTVWEKLRESALTQLDSLNDLLAGQFPKTLQDAFFAQGSGLFPSPAEIKFDCSCPDWASMCKHVAAVLYGVGNRLDQAPELLFTLRAVSVAELIAKTIDATAGKLLDKAATASDEDVLADVDIEGVFGIELDSGDLPDLSLPSPAEISSTHESAVAHKAKGGRTAGRSRQKAAAGTGKNGKLHKQAETGKQNKTKNRSNTTTGKPKAKPGVQQGTMVDQLLAVLPQTRRKFDAAAVYKKLPGWSEQQVRNTLSRAIRDGAIERLASGIYRRR